MASQAAAAVHSVPQLLLALLRQTAEPLGQLLRAAAGMGVDVSRAAAVPAAAAAGGVVGAGAVQPAEVAAAG